MLESVKKYTLHRTQVRTQIRTQILKPDKTALKQPLNTILTNFKNPAVTLLSRSICG